MTRWTDLSDRDHQRFQALIQTRIGILSGDHRRLDLARAVGLAADQAQIDDLDTYYRALVDAATDGDLWSVLIQYVTVGETYFFRNPAHARVLKTEVLPELVHRHRHDRRLRIWSAGCASGEEPYSVAIYLDQLLHNMNAWNIHILATDINRRSLKRAREGQYRMWSLRATPDRMRDRYFTEVTTPERSPGTETFELIPRIRDMVHVSYLNLAEGVYPSPATATVALDLILFRNVAIYLPKPTVSAIADRFHRCLVPGGWLLVGAAETDDSLFTGFEAHRFPGAIIYQKPGLRHKVPSRPPQSEAHVSSEPWVNAQTDPQPTAPVLDPEVVYQQSLFQMQAGNYGQAETHLADCLARRPNYAPAHVQMARIRANQGKYEEALHWCATAREHDPLLADAYTTAATVYWNTERPEEALVELKKALYLTPKDLMVHVGLASVHEQLRHFDEAARHRVQATRLAAGRQLEQDITSSDHPAANERIHSLATTIQESEKES